MPLRNPPVIPPSENYATGRFYSPAGRAFTSNALSQTAGLVRFTFFELPWPMTVTTVRTLPTTLQVGATLAKLGIYSDNADGSLTLLGSCASDTAMWSANVNTALDKNLSTPLPLTAGRYALATLLVGTSTTGILAGQALGLGVVEWLGAPRIAAGLAAQTDLPAGPIASGSLASSGARAYFLLT